jgi:protein-disulfide isomerase
MKSYLFIIGLITSISGVCAAGEAGADVLAEVDGAQLTRTEFENRYTTRLFQARNGYHEAERKALDDFIEQYLLERQAKKENITIEQLMARHVDAKIGPDPSDEALQVYFEGVDTQEPFEAVKGKILDHLRQRRGAKLRTAYIQSLRSQASVAIRMAPPRANVSLKTTPMRGPQNAAVTIVEYADYECPYCLQIHPAMEKLEAEYKGKLAFAFKDTPLPNHPNAQKAAEATHCAGDQGKYWELHDTLLSKKQVELPMLKEYARSLKLDAAAFDKCLDSGAKANLVKTQLAEAQTIGIQGTPSFFINGRFFSGAATYEKLRELIEEELKASTEQKQSGR